jgi:hypothetical protein
MCHGMNSRCHDPRVSVEYFVTILDCVTWFETKPVRTLARKPVMTMAGRSLVPPLLVRYHVQVVIKSKSMMIWYDVIVLEPMVCNMEVVIGHLLSMQTRDVL